MYDLAVIGVGPAGLEAISIAVKNGLKVVAFEEREVGGTCLNVGCIPTKAILHTSNLLKEINSSSKIGINLFAGADFDWGKILDRKMEIVNKFTKHLNSTLSKNITLVKGRAELMVNNDTIEIYAEDNIYEAKNILIATGSAPIELPGLPFDGKFVVNSDDILSMHKLPKRVAIVGSGAIGLEWAKILSDLGCSVKVIEKAPVLAPNLDIELSKRIERILKQGNIEFYKNDYITIVSNDLVTLNSGVAFDTDCIFVAVGRRPVVPRMLIGGCAEEFKLKPEFDGTTDFDNIYVVGDATGGLMLAHAASYQARQIMKKILSKDEAPNKLIPSVIYVTPEIASIGLREQDVEGLEGYKIKKIMVSSIAKSWCDNANEGFVKVILKDDLIVGAHVVGREASILISIFSILIDKKITVDEIEDMVFPHPSYAEAVLEVIKSA